MESLGSDTGVAFLGDGLPLTAYSVWLDVAMFGPMGAEMELVSGLGIGCRRTR